ncbi:MAG: succinate dehydrogenase, hydrophobic membrane anchor protein [Thiotrichales bacterium]|nr:succinate dehydrogenase, hydrophobic membrane anchor protein [Thiotrichales bacterium]
MSLESPLARVRGLGSAKQGSHHWWMQRVSAIALVPLCLWFIAALFQLSSMGYTEVRVWMADPIVSVLLVMMLLALYYHTYVRVQVVIEDYIDSEWQKIGCLLLVKFLCLFAAMISIYSVLKVSLGI